MHKLLWSSVLAASLLATPAWAADDVKKTLRVFKPLAEDIRQLGIHVEFRGSPRLTTVVGQMLAAKGYRVVTSKADADIAFLMSGSLEVKGGGRVGFNAPMSELAESGEKRDIGGTDYTYQTITGESVVVSTIGMRTVSLTDVGLWLSQKTGIAGRANELLTGDPRGICMVDCDNWKRLNHSVSLAIGSVPMEGKPVKLGAWALYSSVYRDKVEAERAIADALVMVLDPFDQAPSPGKTKEEKE